MMIALITRFLRSIYFIGDVMHDSMALRRDLLNRYSGGHDMN
jgi:hypothetical protein